jgi:hypothetical protein
MPKATRVLSTPTTRTSSSIETSVFADAYEFTITDRSMEPRYRPGDIATVSPRLPLKEGNDIFLEVKTARGSRSFVRKLMSANQKALRVFEFRSRKMVTIPRESIVVAHTVLGYYSMP